MPLFRDITGQVSTILASMTPAQKMMTGALSVLVISALIGVAVLSTRPDYRPAFSNLSDSDASQIVDTLESDGIPYRLGASGSSIEVPRDQVARVRMKMASQGLPKDSSRGFEIFDEPQWGLTDSLQLINEQRAYSGSLEQAIRSLEPVVDAKVNLKIPADTVFLKWKEQRRPTASIVLTLNPGSRLGPDQVQAIVYIVTKAVGSGMLEDDVSLIDSRGNLLTAPVNDSETQRHDNLVTFRRAEEEYLAKKAEESVARFIGEDKVSVAINLDIDKDLFREESKKLDPKNRAALSEKIVSSENKNQPPSGGGATGTKEKIDSAGGEVSGPQSSDVTDESETQFDIGSVITRLERSPGSVKRMSVSMILDQSLKDRMDEFASIVKAAVGFNETRDDTFEAIALEHVAKEEEAPVESSGGLAPWILTIVQHLTEAVTVIFTLLLLKSLLKKSSSAKAPVTQTTESASSQPSQDSLHEPDVAIKQQVSMAVQSDPQQAAKILNQWLYEQEEVPA